MTSCGKPQLQRSAHQGERSTAPRCLLGVLHLVPVGHRMRLPAWQKELQSLGGGGGDQLDRVHSARSREPHGERRHPVSAAAAVGPGRPHGAAPDARCTDTGCTFSAKRRRCRPRERGRQRVQRRLCTRRPRTTPGTPATWMIASVGHNKRAGRRAPLREAAQEHPLPKAALHHLATHRLSMQV